ncbi:uncharacterized protein LOC107305445 [Oryza brachyantha]|uniref:uncharacterized protein LOC107305445 n=1 Tax=Oryza brachyantha TaxID=4533 RepID=UPI001ADB5B75|nr:uncharacterized protein LOC107305445 [Oryza brachyantha]
MHIRAERPPWYLSVVGGALYEASSRSSSVFTDYVGYLSKEGSKYMIDMVRRGLGSYKFTMNGSEIEAEIHSLRDAIGWKLSFTYGETEPSGWINLSINVAINMPLCNHVCPHVSDVNHRITPTPRPSPRHRHAAPLSHLPLGLRSLARPPPSSPLPQLAATTASSPPHPSPCCRCACPPSPEAAQMARPLRGPRPGPPYVVCAT